MKIDSTVELGQRLGADRVLSPEGVLPQPAQRLDPSGPVRPYEFEVAVERLCLDSTSFRNIRERSGSDTAAMAERIMEIVSERGKMHNPETDSGGVLLGGVSAIGDRYTDPPEIGERLVTLGSLTLTPLRLDEVRRIDPASPQIEVTGTAYVCDRAAWGTVPDDLPLEATIDLYDVCSAGTHVRDLAPSDGTVLVLGAGHAGKLAMAAARDAMGGGIVAAADVDPDAVELARELGLCDIAVATDLRNPVAAYEAMTSAGVGPADLTVVVVNATECEPTAILLTADAGTVLFFSMATSFSTAALAADGIGSSAQMLVGSGFTPDHGAYALDLFRRSEPLRRSFGVPVGEPA
jgi:L-erythro-3,5-diaminohexanoate dehydrogenase